MFIFARKLIFLTFIYIINTFTLAQPEFRFHVCGDNGNYTRNTTYQRNLDTALSTLPTTNSGFGFFNFSTGEDNDIVNSAALCQGDMEPHLCMSCVNDAIIKLRKLCPNQKEAVGYYGQCMLKYSNNDIIGAVQTEDSGIVVNVKTAWDTVRFIAALDGLMNQLKAAAADGGPLLKFATGNTTGPGFVTIYGLVQCTPDLSEMQCRDCVDYAHIQYVTSGSSGKIGGVVFLPSCRYNYDIIRFYNESTLVVPAPPPPPPILPATPRVLSPPPLQIAESTFTEIMVTTPETISTNETSTPLSPPSHHQLWPRFFNFSTGEDNDIVNSAALCQGDMEPHLCMNCVNDSIIKLRKLCPKQKEAVGYYDRCMLKYSNNDIIGVVQTEDSGIVINIETAWDTDGFIAALHGLMNKLKAAAAGGPLLKFATGNTMGPGFVMIYGLVQCTPDLSEMQCSDCVDYAHSQYVTSGSSRKIGWGRRDGFSTNV